VAFDPYVAENVRRHDLAAPDYDEQHGEIFNATEQRRLSAALARAVGRITAGHRRALDFGSGTGNVAGKLLGLGLETHAADVSREMLRRVERKHPQAAAAGTLRTVTLDGSFPLPFPDRHFAFVAAYSVLHHVPDYLRAVQELVRVLDVGGVLYIDHEANEDHWRSPFWVRAHRALVLPRYALGRVAARLQRLWGRTEPALPPPGQRAVTAEGDIHIYADDHIEWPRVREAAAAGGVSEIETEDYLLCREARFPIRHRLCRGLAADTRLLVGRKARP